MFTRIITVFFALALFVSCKQDVPGRYISESDTSFSKDIRDVSAKINQDPFNADLYYKRGNAFYYQKKLNDAILDFETAVKLDSNNALYHFRLGETCLLKDSANPIQTMFHLKKATVLKKDFYEAEFALAKLLLYRQDYGQAIKAFEKLESQPEYADKAIFFKGMGYKEQKDTLRAMQHFEKVLQLNPQHYDAVMQIASMYLLRDNDLALQYYDRALAINETSDEAYYGKGFFLQQRGEYDKATAMYDKARLINPAHKLALYNTAFIAMVKSQFPKCLELCNAYILLEEKNANAYAMRGTANEKMGNKKAALQDYNAALAIDPKNLPAATGKKIITGN
ncbi:MAG: tetratricopeptide repeat protein [Sphingomonadales bacterium]|jgi:tetratricopeptide (TPR) repeat protein